MFNKVSTVSFEEELIHQNSKPMLFLCDDFNRYYCKSKLQDSHFDYLIYEIIGSRLAKYFSISSPEIALVIFDPDSLGDNFPIYNYDLKPGEIFFGSKHIGNYDTLDKTNRLSIKNRKEYSKILNPYDILKIAIFDVHLNNCDRNDENYNILFHTDMRMFFAIDHAAIFGGPALKGKFSPKGSPSLGQKLLGSHLLRSILKFLSFEQINFEIFKYFSMCNGNLKDQIDEVFNGIPENWNIDKDLKQRVLDYVLDGARTKILNELLLDYLYKIKKKL